MRLSSNMIGNSDDKTTFPHKMLLTNRQVANLCETFQNNSPTDMKFSKAQLPNMIQPGGFLKRLLGPILKNYLIHYYQGYH